MSRFILSFFFLLLSVNLMAQNLVDSLINKIPSSSGEEKVWLLSDISYYTSSQDSEKSVLYAKECLRTAKDFGDEGLIAEGYNALGIAWFANGNYEKALFANKEALKIREETGNAKALISSFNKIANCYHELGNYKEAIHFNLKALKLSENNGFDAYTGMLLTNIGEIYKAQRKFEKALEYYDSAIYLARKTADTLAWAKALNNAGVAHRELNANRKAVKNYEQGLELIKGKNFRDTEGALLLNLGVVASKKGENQKAFNYYRRAFSLTELIGDRHGMAVACNNLGSNYLEVGKTDSALYFLEKSVEYSKEMNLRSQLLQSYEGLEKYYKLASDYQQALHYDSLGEVLKDALISVENARILEDLNIRYKTEKKEKTLAEQALRIEKDASRLKSFILMFIVLAFVLVIIGILVIQRQRTLKKRVLLEKAESETRLKDEKLRISRDLHDNIGSHLTLFKNQLEHLSQTNENNMIAPALESLSSQTQITIRELRESIWTIQTEEVSYEELIGKVATQVQQIKNGAFSISLENNMSDRLLSEKISPSKAMAIFRVIQEAINNSMKHSHAKTIIVAFDPNQISVKDDGIGFNLEESASGYGLINMEARLSEVGMDIIIWSKKNKGTEVCIPLT